MKEALEEYRLERANLENEIAEFLSQKFADFKEKTGAEVIYLDVEFESSEDLDEDFFISSVFVGTDL
ncbi:MAG: hypothetical protein LKF82_07170 [Acinetobacter populi]|jgi:hypothetical protein|uniref:hypothetical protein n=1 Tax=Acinetobacter populi TaxID=1582270 RepID=UPI00235279F1|nr:hypothetical protein [Acinetobacter populi]MCH4247606.1 hypothetical protein [Acinetobacter populi]